MSISATRSQFVNPLLRKLEQSRRSELQTLKGQLLILDNLDSFIKIIEAETKQKVKSSTAKKALAAGRKEAASLQRNFQRRFPKRATILERKLLKVPGLARFNRSTDLYILESFGSSVSRVKSAILNAFEKDLVFNEQQKDRIRNGIHKGHGQLGDAVSQVEILSALSGAGEGKKQFLDFLNQKLAIEGMEVTTKDSVEGEIKDLVTNYDKVLTRSGKLRADYVSILTFQEGAENSGVDAARERLVKNTFRSFVREFGATIIDIPGSSSTRDQIEGHLVDTFAPKGAKIKKSSAAKKGNKPSKGRASSKAKNQETKVRAKRKRSKTNNSRFESPSSSPISLIAILNERLPDVVAANMGSPRLNYRTGRFARSVKILDEVITPSGFRSIGYTYQKYPYQTFEPGYAQGSEARDPRKIIDFSIREIAASFAIGRFYTRRL